MKRLNPLVSNICIAYLYFNIHTIYATSMDDVSVLMNDLFKNYSTDVRPVKDQSNAVTVYVDFYIGSINNFDEVSGVIFITGLLNISWQDESLIWNYSDYGNTTTLTIAQNKVWLPTMFLTNPANSFEPVSSKHFKVTITSLGYMLWVPGDILKVTCAANVAKFPYDTQTCAISVTAHGYTKKEVRIRVPSSTVYFNYFSQNSEWDVTESNTFVKSDTYIDIATFSISMKRRSTNFVVNVVIPIILLAVINPLVFILPLNSGERASYSITVLLAFTVCMTVVSDKMPESSDPMSYLSYYLLCMLGMSVLIVTANIFQITLHNKNEEDEPVPAWIYWLFKTLKKILRHRKVAAEEQSSRQDYVQGEKDILQRLDQNQHVVGNIRRKSPLDEQHVNDLIITRSESLKWNTVRDTMDKLYFGVFLALTVISSLILFVKTIK